MTPKTTFLSCFCCLMWISTAETAAAGFKDDVGFTLLKTRLGANAPSGTGIPVTQIESTEPPTFLNYLADTTHPEFAGKTITDLTGSSAAPSTHATEVGKLFYGSTTAMASNITAIDAYEANDFLGAGFLQAGNSFFEPDVENSQVQNHSWVGSSSLDTNIIRRFDHAIARDNFTAVVGLNNGSGTAIPNLMAHSYNAISVGLTSGNHSRGTTTLEDTGRTKPDIVVPHALVSYACPMVAGAAAMLRETASASPSLANALYPDTIKAILMAGATKGEIPTWDRTYFRPLDDVYGAGELNVLNSHSVLISGEQNSSSTGTVSTIGWDTDVVTSGTTSLYFFTVSPGRIIAHFSAILTWNRIIEDADPGPQYNPVPQMPAPNLELRLYSATNLSLLSPLDWSTGRVDNVEHIYRPELAEGQYALEVTGNTNTAYALAWSSKDILVPEAVEISTTNDWFEAAFNVSTGFTYIVQATTNLVDAASWTDLATNDVTTAPYIVGDTDSTNWLQRYYRIIPHE